MRCSFDSYRKIDYSIKDLSVNVAVPEAMDIPVILILSYIFVGIMSLYAINLDAAMFIWFKRNEWNVIEVIEIISP